MGISYLNSLSFCLMHFSSWLSYFSVYLGLRSYTHSFARQQTCKSCSHTALRTPMARRSQRLGQSVYLSGVS